SSRNGRRRTDAGRRTERPGGDQRAHHRGVRPTADRQRRQRDHQLAGYWNSRRTRRVVVGQRGSRRGAGEKQVGSGGGGGGGGAGRPVCSATAAWAESAGSTDAEAPAELAVCCPATAAWAVLGGRSVSAARAETRCSSAAAAPAAWAASSGALAGPVAQAGHY